MLYVVGAIIFVIVLLIIGVSYSQMQDAKKEEEKQVSLGELARQTQNQYRDLAKTLTDSGLVSPQTRHKFSSISSNFFVFQSINESNITYLQSLTELFSTLIEVIENTPETEQLINEIELTAHKIPTQARDFTSEFYISIAPKLLSDLVKAIELINQMDSEQEGQETDSAAEAESENELQSEEAKQHNQA